MNLWIITAVIVGLLLIAGITVASFTTADEVSSNRCKSCDRKCTEEKNCGFAGCKAVNDGDCRCGV